MKNLEGGTYTILEGSALGHLGLAADRCPCFGALVTDGYPCSNLSTLRYVEAF